jgi:hypothetical protein
MPDELTEAEKRIVNELLAYIRERGRVSTSEIADEFGFDGPWLVGAMLSWNMLSVCGGGSGEAFIVCLSD